MKDNRMRNLLALTSGITLSLVVLLLVSSSTSFRNNELSSTSVSAIRSGTDTQEVVVDVHHQQQQQQQQQYHRKNKEDHVQFVFIVGLEGTGHHLLQDLVAESPAVSRIKELNVEEAANRLHKLLHPNGLFDAVCDFVRESNLGMETWKVGQQLQRVKRKLSGPTPQTVFFNAEQNEISYPLGVGDCRQLHYPDLDALYALCDAAGAQCGHIYMYRDPYEVVHSAKVRNLNPTVLAATKTYYSMLNIIYAQFAAHAERTLGCWGFFDGLSADTDLWDNVQELLLWDDKAEFESVVQRVVQERHPPLTEEEKKELVPDNLSSAMDSMIKAHRRTLELCQSQASLNRMTTFT